MMILLLDLCLTITLTYLYLSLFMMRKHDHHDFQELKKAIKERKQEELNVCIKRWKRLNLDEEEKVFKSALA